MRNQLNFSSKQIYKTTHQRTSKDLSNQLKTTIFIYLMPKRHQNIAKIISKERS